MAATSDMKALGGLVLGLLTLAIMVGATFLVSGSFLDSLCDQANSTNVYDGTNCETAAGVDVATDPDSVQKVESVVAVITTVLSFLSIIIIVGIAKIILRLAKGMQ